MMAVPVAPPLQAPKAPVSQGALSAPHEPSIQPSAAPIAPETISPANGRST